MKKCIKSFILLFGMLVLGLVCGSGMAQSPTIQQEVKDLPLSDEDRAREVAKRNAVENIQNKGINAGLYQQGLPPITSKSTEVDPIQNIITVHFGEFCDQAATNEGGNNYSCQQDIRFAHGDIKFSTILSPSRYGSSDDKASEAQTKAIGQFLQNIIDPFPSDAFQKQEDVKAESLKDPEKREALARSLVDEAYRSIARQSFAEMVAKRTAQGGGESTLQKMEKEANRYLDPAWQKKIKEGADYAQKQNPTMVVLYDIAVMDAYRDWLEFERYKQGERLEALLAAQLVQLSNQGKYAKSVVTEGQKTTPVESK